MEQDVFQRRLEEDRKLALIAAFRPGTAEK